MEQIMRNDKNKTEIKWKINKAIIRFFKIYNIDDF